MGEILSAIGGVVAGMLIAGLMSTNAISEEFEKRLNAEIELKKIKSEYNAAIKRIKEISEEAKRNDSMDL